jgi:hypothetical protein
LIQIKPAAAQRLRSNDCATSMRTMFRFSRSTRRFVAGAAAVLFLACHGTAIVYAHSNGAPGSSAGVAQGSCHGAGRDADKNTDNSVYQAQCQFQHTSSSSPASGANIFAAADLPAITARVDRIVAVADSVLLPEPPLLRVEPPPLTILHCCLRN